MDRIGEREEARHAEGCGYRDRGIGVFALVAEGPAFVEEVGGGWPTVEVTVLFFSCPTLMEFWCCTPAEAASQPMYGGAVLGKAD